MRQRRAPARRARAALALALTIGGAALTTPATAAPAAPAPAPPTVEVTDLPAGFQPSDIDDRGRLIGQTGDLSNPAVGREPAVRDRGEITVLPTMGPGLLANPSFVNDRGQIAGYATPPSAADQTVVRWDGGGIVDVGAQPSLRLLQLRDLTDRGEVLVGGFTADFRTAGAVWDDGAIVWLPPGDGGEAAPVAMNDRGQVVGSRRGLDRTQPMTPTLWEL